MQARDVWIYGIDLYIVNKSMPDLQDRWKALTSKLCMFTPVWEFLSYGDEGR